MVLKKTQRGKAKAVEVHNSDPRLPAYYRNLPQPKTEARTAAIERNWTEQDGE
jgi:hypothetical protein